MIVEIVGADGFDVGEDERETLGNFGGSLSRRTAVTEGVGDGWLWRSWRRKETADPRTVNKVATRSYGRRGATYLCNLRSPILRLC